MVGVKDKVEEILDELDSYKGKWMNVYFYKNGSSANGCAAFESEGDARAKAEKYLKNADCAKFHGSKCPYCGNIVPYSGLSHAIQLPRMTSGCNPTY